MLLLAIPAFLATLYVAGSSLAAPAEQFGGQMFDIPDPAKSGRGGEVYLAACAGCHDGGVERAPVRNVFTYMSPQSIVHALTNGTMKDQAEGLSAEDKLAVAEFLSGRKLSAVAEAPEPPICEGTAAKFDFNAPPAPGGWGMGANNQRHVPAEQSGLGRRNAAQLKLKWAVAFPNALQARSQPAIAGGALYVGSHNGKVYALDSETGCARWSFQAGAEVRTGIVVSDWKAGDGKARPQVYFGDIVGNVFALDARDGSLAWRIRADDHPGATITAAPALQGDRLFVAVSSLEGVRAADPAYECCTSRGSVVAVDAMTGEQIWKRFTTDTPVLRGVNAKGARQFGPSGASIWGTPAIDAKRGLIYVGTGGNNSAPANDQSDSILALDMASGAVRWAYQATQQDMTNLACMSADKSNCPNINAPDFDFGAAPMLVTTAKGRDLVIGGQKSGVVHAIAPSTGRMQWKTRVGRGGLLGGVHFGMASNGQYIFVPVNDPPDGRGYPDKARPGVFALDPEDGRIIWSAPASDSGCAGKTPCTPGYSQAITATDELVFAGSVDGWMRIFDAQSGALLWQVDTDRRVVTVNGGQSAGGSFGGGSGPVPYEGALYISSGYSLAGSRPGNLLMAFSTR